MEPTEVLQHWAERSGEYSPDYYAYYGPNETSEVIQEHLDSVLDVAPADASVLELGCSAGRHLAHLHDAGYGDLHGIDVNDDAFDVMAEAYPDLATAGTFYAAAIEDMISDVETNRFDAIYSVETLQHVHPDNEWVFEELARVTERTIITVENEGDGNPGDGEVVAGVNYVDDGLPLYYRRWDRVFPDLNLQEVETAPNNQDTLRVFRHE